MKYMNMGKKFGVINLQLFAGEDDGDDPGDGDDQDGDDPDEGGDDDGREKRFSQKDVDEAVQKRLAREKRKWQRQQRKKSGEDTDPGDDGGSEDAKARKAAEDKASAMEVKIACYEADVAKDAVDDVAALAKAYMAADDSLDLEDAIEKVIKKYPQFKKGAADPYDEDDMDTKKKSWGERQKGRGKKTSGVEDAFLKRNPGLKID